jgi:hypothetical protein
LALPRLRLNYRLRIRAWASASSCPRSSSSRSSSKARCCGRFWLSFTSYDLVGTPRLVRFDNFTRVVNEPVFVQALNTTLSNVGLYVGFVSKIS